jgi:sarcosine oxidase subunit gamma
MPDIALAQRTGPLDGRLFADNGISLTPAPAATRIVLRVRQEGKATAKRTIGFALPEKPGSSVNKGSIHCLWIGPDEWLVIDDEGSALPGKFENLGNDKLSAVDVSHRNTAIIVSGKTAANAINSGCPQDLSVEAFPVGAASRTILGKAEIILYRTGEMDFRIEVWRSFSDYAWKYMVDAVKSV